MAKPTIDQVIEAVESDDSIGFCLSCGNEQGGCEPDARNYTCEACDLPKVFGAEECLFILG